MSDDPSGPRLQFAAELKAARERNGYTTEQIARQLKCTAATIRRWERGGTGNPRYADLLRMFEIYRIVDPEQRAMLEELHEQADQPVWWSRFKPTDVMSRMVGFETIATEIWVYERSLVPGLLQTELYARAVMPVLDCGDPGPGTGLELRLERQRRVLKSPSPPKLRVLLDEDAMRWPAVPCEVMREQLDYLYKGPYPYQLRILPRSLGVHPGSLGSFFVFHFPRRLRNPAAYSEGPLRTLFLDEPEDVARASHRYEKLWNLALPGALSLDLIHTMLEELA